MILDDQFHGANAKAHADTLFSSLPVGPHLTLHLVSTQTEAEPLLLYVDRFSKKKTPVLLVATIAITQN